MGEKIVVGPINRGLRNDRTPFVIDNDSFPTLINAYQWRGRVKRKRGTSLLGRLTRFFNSANASYGNISSFNLVSGAGNLLVSFNLQTGGNIDPGSVILVDATTGNSFTDDSHGNLVGVPAGTGTINYATGAITISGGASDTINDVSFLYTPDLPVMGLEDFISNSVQYPGTLGFDTTYSYAITNAAPYFIYDVSFYKNTPTATYPGYVQKIAETPTSWNGQDYQQFYTVNYQGALWATNGITVPFNTTNIGMQFKPITNITSITAGPPAFATLTIASHGLVKGDFIFINEVGGVTGINYQTGYVTTVVDVNNVTVEFPYATLGGAYTSGGIAQYLTNRSDPTKDCLRWYDGDPTNGSATNPVLNGNLGWVNFAPPLSNAIYSIAELPTAQYYLVGARMIVPFKDRLLFLGPVVQTSGNGAAPIYLQDTIIYSQNGTPYYTSSFTAPAINYPLNPTAPNGYVPILVPSEQTATPSAYFEDITGFGGFISAGLDQEILTVGPNEDVLILGFTRLEARLVYSGSDVVPFNFFIINSELGSGSTFSSITMDKGIITRGSRGFLITSQVESRRIDLVIPDEVFQIQLSNNGNERVTAQRDYINEWIYMTYPVNSVNYKFPNQTLQYNYTDDSWGIFSECYTTYGQFRRLSGYTWATIGLVFPTWSSWNQPWNSGSTTLLQPQVIGGNQQGFVLFRDEGTNEGNSLYIDNISYPVSITGASQAAQAVLTANNTFAIGQQITITGVVGMTQLNNNTYTIAAVTPTTITISVNSTGFTPYISGGTATPVEPVYSPNHCLNSGDYIIISGCIGTSSVLNGKIFSVSLPTTNGFSLNPPLPAGLTYFGGGLIKRMYVPLIQTKQFPVSWGNARKTRLGPQQYLFTTTPVAQITLLIFLSQDSDTIFNMGPIVPDPNAINDSLIYSTILYTCPESTNLGLTPANVNLQMPTAINQEQTWHRMNTSLLGDTVQIGFTLSDSQMRDTGLNNQFAEVEFHAMILDVSPSQLLA